MSLNNILPAWAIMMPFDEWSNDEITDEEFLAWLEDPKNGVPEQVIEGWREKLQKELDMIT